MSDLLQWFSQQSDAVKLALIGLATGVFGGFFAVVKEWRKPVLNAPTATAQTVRAADDPALLILGEVAAMNVNLAQLLKEAQTNNSNSIKLIEAIRDLEREMITTRGVLMMTRGGVD